MTQSAPNFRTLMRGYDRVEVGRALAERQQRVAEADASAGELEARYQEAASRADAHAAAAEEARSAKPATFEHLGARIGQILALAEEEAAQLREQARAEAE